MPFALVAQARGAVEPHVDYADANVAAVTVARCTPRCQFVGEIILPLHRYIYCAGFGRSQHQWNKGLHPPPSAKSYFAQVEVHFPQPRVEATLILVKEQQT